MKKPKVSVIMATHNAIPYLKEAVKSILTQTYRDFEFIIVDDASTDNSWQYLNSLKDSRIRPIKNDKNLGLAKSLNVALAKARGIFIARMDSDDISLPSRLYEQIKFLEEHSQIALCGTWAHLINENGKVIGQKKYPTSDSQIQKSLAWFSPIIHPSLTLRKRVFDLIGPYNLQFELAEDYELLIRAKSKFKMANVPKILFKWRLWDNRRSRIELHRMDEVDLKIKIEAFKRGDFGPFYFIQVLKKIVTTYFFPLSLKLKLAKIFKLA